MLSVILFLWLLNGILVCREVTIYFSKRLWMDVLAAPSFCLFVFCSFAGSICFSGFTHWTLTLPTVFQRLLVCSFHFGTQDVYKQLWVLCSGSRALCRRENHLPLSLPVLGGLAVDSRVVSTHSSLRTDDIKQWKINKETHCLKSH